MLTTLLDLTPCLSKSLHLCKKRSRPNKPLKGSAELEESQSNTTTAIMVSLHQEGLQRTETMWTNNILLWCWLSSSERCCRTTHLKLSDSARAMLAHASYQNPAIRANLWPYAIRHASYVRQMLPQEGHSKSPKEFFS